MEVKEKDIWEFLEEEPRWGKEVKALYEWSLNCEGFAPFRKFLDLIGYSEENFGTNFADWNSPAFSLGYKELDYLADALKEYADNPIEVEKYIDNLLEAERNGF